MKLHTSCETLKLDSFITCMVDKDFTPLIIEGEPEEAELLETWDKIYQEYVDIIGTDNDNYVLVVAAEIERLYYKFKVIDESLKVLRYYRSEELVSIFKQMGFNFEFSLDDEEQYLKDLDRVENRAKSIIVHLEDKKKEFERLSKSSGASKPINRTYFNGILAALSKFMGSMINEGEITVSRYASTLNLYIKHAELVNNKTL